MVSIKSYTAVLNNEQGKLRVSVSYTLENDGFEKKGHLELEDEETLAFCNSIVPFLEEKILPKKEVVVEELVP